MVVTKAARSQRARRAAEARAAQELAIQERIKKKKKNKVSVSRTTEERPIVINNNDQDQALTNEDKPILIDEDHSQLDVFNEYNEDEALIDKSHQIMKWCNKSNESNNEEDLDEVAPLLWPISFLNAGEPHRQKLKLGNSGYRQSVPFSNPDSKKRVPRKLP
jgi:hypothetical protein